MYQGCRHKVPQTGPGGGKSDIEVWSGFLSSEAVRKNPPHVSLLAAGGLSLFVAVDVILLVFTWPSCCMCVSPFYDTNRIGLGPILKS